MCVSELVLLLCYHGQSINLSIKDETSQVKSAPTARIGKAAEARADVTFLTSLSS